MAAPSLAVIGSGATDAGGAWTYSPPESFDPLLLGQLFIFWIVQDGSTNGAVTHTSMTNLQSLAGGTSTLTALGNGVIGSPTSARWHFWMGRVTSTTVTISGGNSTSEDLYFGCAQWQHVIRGTTTSEILGGVGTAANQGTGTTLTQPSFNFTVKNGLLLAFMFFDDDIATPGTLDGESGPTWGARDINYQEASGTDAAYSVYAASIDGAGSSGSGTATITSCGWSCVVFQLAPYGSLLPAALHTPQGIPHLRNR